MHAQNARTWSKPRRTPVTTRLPLSVTGRERQDMEMMREGGRKGRCGGGGKQNKERWATRARTPALSLPHPHSLVIFLSINRFSSGGLTLDMVSERGCACAGRGKSAAAAGWCGARGLGSCAWACVRSRPVCVCRATAGRVQATGRRSCFVRRAARARQKGADRRTRECRQRLPSGASSLALFFLLLR